MLNNFDPKVDNPDNYRWGIFYYNTDDSRIFVPKQNWCMGWTINCGNHFTYLLFGGILAVAGLFKLLV